MLARNGMLIILGQNFSKIFDKIGPPGGEGPILSQQILIKNIYNDYNCLFVILNEKIV